jgi:hypothetical protein
MLENARECSEMLGNARKCSRMLGNAPRCARLRLGLFGHGQRQQVSLGHLLLHVQQQQQQPTAATTRASLGSCRRRVVYCCCNRRRQHGRVWLQTTISPWPPLVVTQNRYIPCTHANQKVFKLNTAIFEIAPSIGDSIRSHE